MNRAVFDAMLNSNALACCCSYPAVTLICVAAASGQCVDYGGSMGHAPQRRNGGRLERVARADGRF
jgi:hypothetical protein